MITPLVVFFISIGAVGRTAAGVAPEPIEYNRWWRGNAHQGGVNEPDDILRDVRQ